MGTKRKRPYKPRKTRRHTRHVSPTVSTADEYSHDERDGEKSSDEESGDEEGSNNQEKDLGINKRGKKRKRAYIPRKTSKSFRRMCRMVETIASQGLIRKASFEDWSLSFTEKSGGIRAVLNAIANPQQSDASLYRRDDVKSFVSGDLRSSFRNEELLINAFRFKTFVDCLELHMDYPYAKMELECGTLDNPDFFVSELMKNMKVSKSIVLNEGMLCIEVSFSFLLSLQPYLGDKVPKKYYHYPIEKGLPRRRLDIFLDMTATDLDLGDVFTNLSANESYRLAHGFKSNLLLVWLESFILVKTRPYLLSVGQRVLSKRFMMAVFGSRTMTNRFEALLEEKEDW